MKEHVITGIHPGSIAEELGIEIGDKLSGIRSLEESIVGEEEACLQEETSTNVISTEEIFAEIEDIFDYEYLIQDTHIEILIEKPDGEEWILEIEKEPDEDLGIEFENGLMDEYRRCRNKCLFCFIDQIPPGMRETLYFKDDDSRLSFLQGNYVTLTNMSDKDIDRICKYHLSPINISFHTMNPELRCKMLNNRFAGEALKKVDTLYGAGIRMNGQIVLCKGLNDGKELESSIVRLMKYAPTLESVSVVPVGLTKYRKGLYPLEPFTQKNAADVIDMIEEFQKECIERFGIHFIHASDEWYILAEREMPEDQRYDGYPQLENGVGMLRLLMTEFEDAMEQHGCGREETEGHQCELSIATGRLAYPFIQKMAERMIKEYSGLQIHVYPIRNDFFGERITVSGLLTGQDLIAQLKKVPLGDCLLLPENILRSGEDVFLDDYRKGDLEKALQVPINIVKSSGYDFVETILGYYFHRER